MRIQATILPEVLLIESHFYGDEQEFFYESFNACSFATLTGVTTPFVQDNHSKSAQNVLRGLHYQIEHAQGKLVRVVAGEIFNVCVDIRRSSPSFGQWVGLPLSAENRRKMWIPAGFAHGFVATSETAEVIYKTTDFRAPNYERCILWCDPAVGIEWPLSAPPALSARDKRGKLLAEAELYS
jgi:dTDP-4-dehydrorhamnose 3,5-epimerase